MAKKPLKMFKVNNISEVRDVDALYCIKTATDTEFSIVVTDAFGAIVNLKDLQTPAGIQGIASDDGTIEVTGTTFKNLRLSTTLVDAINNALKPGDNISDLINDAGYLTSFTEADPIFQASEASNFVSGDKANLDNQSGVNTGDETSTSIQVKRPLKTVDNKSLEGTGNIEIDYNTVINKPTEFPPSTHTHTKSQITDFAHTHPISDVTGLPTALEDLQLNKEDKANKVTDFTTINDTFYPSVQAVKNEIINSKNYVSVKDFGATGNGVTDDTPAINSALTYCETINGTLFFPSGNYLTTGNFIINSKISIKGEGESLNIITDPLPTVFNAGSSNIISSSTTNNLFVVNVDGVSFENITLSCSAVSTTGAGVVFNKGNVMRMDNVGVRSFNINVDVVNGASWNVSNCDFYNPITNNIRINHLLLTDGGDQSIFSCNFFTGTRTGITHLLYRGGGGLKITNSKFNQGGGTAALAKECIKLTNDVGNTVDFLVSNSSFENYTDRAINISPVFLFENIIINGNQFSASVTTSIDVILIGTSLAHSVVIANNIIDAAVNGVNYALGNNVSVDNNLFGPIITNRYVYPAPFYPKIIPSKVSIGNLYPQYNFNVYSDNDKTVNAYNVVSSVLSKDASSQQGLFFTLKGGLSTSDRYASITSYENGFGGLPLVFQSLGEGKVFINKTTDDGTGAELQINGTISASPATSSNQVVVKSQLDAVTDTQIEISTNSNTLNAWNGKTVLFTANCTITVPATLLPQFGFVFRTLAGVTVTWTITAPFTWETTPTTTPEKTTGSFMRRGSTNTILLDF